MVKRSALFLSYKLPLQVESAGRVIQLPRSGLLHIKRVSVKADLIVKTTQYLRIM